MSTANTDTYNLRSVSYQGIINEDTMQKIWNIDPVDLPFFDMAGTGEAATNMYKSWTKESLAAPDITNAKVDGADAGSAASFTEARIGNWIQLSDKVVRVADGAQAVDTIGYSDRLLHELMIRQKELKRDMEAIACGHQASVAMTDEVAGKTAGIGAMFTTSANITNGTAGGFSSGIFATATPGAATGLTETALRDAAQAAYAAGGNPSVVMSTPSMIRKISEYLFSSTARVATFMSNVGTDAKQGKYGKQGVTAVGAVNTLISDFDTLEFVPNRTQQTYLVSATACVSVYLLDPNYWEVSYLSGIKTTPLARTGTAENRQMTAYWMTVALQEKSSAVLMGINPATAVVAG